MATNRLAELLKSRSDFTEEEIARMSENAAWDWIRASSGRENREDNEQPDSEH